MSGGARWVLMRWWARLHAGAVNISLLCAMLSTMRSVRGVWRIHKERTCHLPQYLNTAHAVDFVISTPYRCPLFFLFAFPLPNIRVIYGVAFGACGCRRSVRSTSSVVGAWWSGCLVSHTWKSRAHPIQIGLPQHYVRGGCGSSVPRKVATPFPFFRQSGLSLSCNKLRNVLIIESSNCTQTLQIRAHDTYNT